MTVTVAPNKKCTHHVSLSAGGKTIGLIACNSAGDADGKAIVRSPMNRTAMKTTTGNQKYSDYEPPWTPIAQEDWSGGRGSDDFDKDTTRYRDGFRANTLYSKIIHGPQEQYCTGLRSEVTSMPGNVTWWSLISGAGKYLANRFSPGTFTGAQLWLLVRRRGTPTAVLTVNICADDSGSPGAASKTMTISTTDITDTLSEWWVLTIPSNISLSSGTNYWIEVYSTAGDDKNHWEVGCNPTRVYGKQSADGTTWESSTVDMYYRVLDASSNVSARFFQYKRAFYMVRSIASAASTLWINGDRGTADANTGALTTLIDATKSWTTDEWKNCYVILTAGVGSNETQTWRKITGNTATTLTVDSTWEITHSTTTEYVIVGSNKWTEITGTGITARVTDVLTVNDLIYFAQGDSVLIRSGRFYTTGGNWTAAYRDEGVATNMATFLKTVRDPDNGTVYIWRANNIDANGFVSVSKSAVVNYASDLSFGTAVTFKDNYGKITGLEEYGDTSKYLWVFREGTIYAIVTDKADEIPLREIRALESSSNGIAHTIHNAYLYVNLGGGLEQYYNRQLSDVGTNRDEGLPEGRKGTVTDLLGYPGRLFEAIDAGTTGYSQIHGWNTTGWCEMYRAPKGKRIGCIAFQAIPDVGLDRMWIQQGNDIVWLPFPSATLDPSKDPNYLYTHEIAVESGWIMAGLPDVFKLYNAFKLFAEQLEEDTVWVEVDYKKDQDDDWTPIDEVFEESPLSEYDLDPDDSVIGKRLCYRIRSYTADATKTSVIKGTVVETISRIPIKHSLSLTYRLNEESANLLGENDNQGTPDDIQATLDEWAQNLTRVKVRCYKEIFDDKRVFLDAMPVSVTGEHSENYSGKLTLIEV